MVARKPEELEVQIAATATTVTKIAMAANIVVEVKRPPVPVCPRPDSDDEMKAPSIYAFPTAASKTSLTSRPSRKRSPEKRVGTCVAGILRALPHGIGAGSMRIFRAYVSSR